MELYPEQLYQLYQDLDDLTYGTITPELLERIPPSLEAAEKTADDILRGHLEETLSKIPKEQYFQMVMKTATAMAKKLYLIRCYIAGARITAEPDKIEIYHSSYMATTNFHEEQDIERLEDGGIMINEPESDNPYNRALTHVPKGTIKTIQEEPQISIRDVLPEEMLSKSKKVLNDYGIEINEQNAWPLLSKLGKEATIDERIIGRLLYLIENANAVDRGVPLLTAEVVSNERPECGR